uniref:Uncharacterized protein n=1 Tax=viral metagenome TaxID=1070528 RepID=A0A6H1ZYK8_9ZZZZ
MFTTGDLIIIEIALTSFFRNLEIGTGAGQQVNDILGKCEYEIRRIQEAVKEQKYSPLNPLVE